MPADVDSYFKRTSSMIFPLIAIPFGRIQLYQKPISMRFGERKLTQLCRQELGREPKTNELFLFYNTKRDTLKLFWRDGNGSQEITKALPRGGFILPAPKDGEAFVTLARSKLESVFRTGKK
jgi:transposase